VVEDGGDFTDGHEVSGLVAGKAYFGNSEAFNPLYDDASVIKGQPASGNTVFVYATTASDFSISIARA